MGCVCSLSSVVSTVLDALERISTCTVCALLTCCLLATLITVMIFGIGIGYSYCFVQNSVRTIEKPAARSGSETSGPGNLMRSVDRALQRRFAHRVARREAGVPLEGNTNSTTSSIESNLSRSNLTNLAGAMFG